MTATIPLERKSVWYKSPLTWFYIVIGLFLTAVLAFNIFRPITVLPQITLGPGYLLYNQNGDTVSNESYRGKLALYSFSYANCDGCPQSPQQIAALHQKLEADMPADIDFSLVTITLDPERDTPERLQELAAEVQAEEPVNVPWDFLTGDPLKIRYAIGYGFSLYYKAQEPDAAGNYQIDHKPLYMLVDQWGIIRAEYFTAEPRADIVVRDAKLITDEAINREKGGDLAYDAAHLFLCYPR